MVIYVYFFLLPRLWAPKWPSKQCMWPFPAPGDFKCPSLIEVAELCLIWNLGSIVYAYGIKWVKINLDNPSGRLCSGSLMSCLPITIYIDRFLLDRNRKLPPPPPGTRGSRWLCLGAILHKKYTFKHMPHPQHSRKLMPWTAHRNQSADPTGDTHLPSQPTLEHMVLTSTSAWNHPHHSNFLSRM